jgi:2,4-dienoyl-CoA reductase-like NADH-dependent reductase (Old Yellow Enzyme family)
MTSKLFTPIQLGGLTLPNRIVVAPMCQYSAADGCMSDWHFGHLSSLAISGAGLVVIEATAVTRDGRISHGCTGLYSDHNEAAMKRVVDHCRRLTKNPIGVQLAHAGRKASTQVPWEGRSALGPLEDPWPTVAPSALPYDNRPGWHTPRELSVAGIRAIVDAFAASTQRALRLGLDSVELHAAHGYLMHQFFSPVSNHRKDAYGGSLENRLRAPLEAARAVRESWPRDRCLGARISGHDWVDDGAPIEDTIALAKALKEIGYDYVCVTSGALLGQTRYTIGPNYQVPLAAAVKKAVPEMAVRAVGMIADPDQAEEIVASGKADMVAMARAFLDNPRWVWHAAERFGVPVTVPPQYERARYDAWPGSKLARPQEVQAAVKA